MNPSQQAIVDQVNASPFNRAVDDLCAAVRLVLPDASKEDIERLAPKFSTVLVEALDLLARTGSRTAVVVAEGLQKEVAALREECRTNHAETLSRFDAHLQTHEAGK